MSDTAHQPGQVHEGPWHGSAEQRALWGAAEDLERLRKRLALAEQVIDAAVATLDRFRIIPATGWPSGLRAFLELHDQWEEGRR